MLRAVALLALIPLASCTSCVLDIGSSGVRGSGVAAGEERQVAEFERLAVAGGWSVDVTAGAARRVRVECDDNLLPLLETEVDDGELVVRFSESVSPRAACRLTVETPRLSGVRMAGATRLELRDLDEPLLELSGAGSTRVIASGRVEELVVDAAGSADFDLLELAARRATVKAAGSADVELDVADELEVRGSGSVAVRYTGDPRSTSSISGSGSVKRLGE